MEYSNPEIPEGINTTPTHPLKEFFILTVGVIVILVTSLYLLILTIDYFADMIPFSWEEKIPVAQIIADKNTIEPPQYLTRLTEDIVAAMDLPDDMKITLHYSNSDIVNAFATLGGHLVLYRGLLEKIKSEDELAMVIAHEVAHIKYRHPVAAASHGIATTLILSLIGTSSDNALGRFMGTTGMLTVMKFSRDFEYEADADAVSLLVKRYGHAQGAVGLFSIFKEEMADSEPVEFLNTHPLTEKRIHKAMLLTGAVTNRTQDKKMKPLSAEFVNWLASQAQVEVEDKTDR